MSDRILRTAAARNCMGHRGACWVAEKTNVNASGQRAVGSAAQQGRAWTSRSGESASWMRADMPPLATSCSARVASLHKLASAAAAGRCSSASAVGSPLGCAAAEQKGCFYIFVCSTGILTVALQGKFYVLSAKSKSKSKSKSKHQCNVNRVACTMVQDLAICQARQARTSALVKVGKNGTPQRSASRLQHLCSCVYVSREQCLPGDLV